MKEEIHQRIKKAINEKVFPGCVFGVSVKGQRRSIFSEGRFTYEETSHAVSDNTVYDIASVTKVIPTSLSLLTLIDQGKVCIEDQVVSYIPEFGNSPAKEKVLIKHLLTYTLNLVIPSMTSMKDFSPEKIIETVVSAELREEPGTNFLYTNATAMLVGLIVRNVTGSSLEEFSRATFFDPLEMNDTTFHPEDSQKENIPPTEIDEWRGGVVQGVVHDESTYSLKAKCHLGVAGLFSNTPDLLTLLEVILDCGIKDGTRYFSKEMIENMPVIPFRVSIETPGLGWKFEQPLQPHLRTLLSDRTLGQTGFTGCFVLCDQESGVAITMISNRTFPKRPESGKAISELRSDLVDIVYRSLDN